jgi:hypothetical protein
LHPKQWRPGDHVLLRGVLNGRLLSAEPYVIVHDSPNQIVMWRPTGTPWMKPDGRDQVVAKRLSGEWTLSRNAPDPRWTIPDLPDGWDRL